MSKEVSFKNHDLLGSPYYDATDWNFIPFHCGAYDWLMQNGELYQIYQ